MVLVVTRRSSKPKLRVRFRLPAPINERYNMNKIFATAIALALFTTPTFAHTKTTPPKDVVKVGKDIVVQAPKGSNVDVTIDGKDVDVEITNPDSQDTGVWYNPMTWFH